MRIDNSCLHPIKVCPDTYYITESCMLFQCKAFDKYLQFSEINRNISEALNGNKIDRKTKVITVNDGATSIELITNVSATYGEYPVVIATNGDGLANSIDIAATRIQNDICYAILAKAVTTAGNMRINYTVIY